MKYNYSVEVLKKAAFVDELNNILKLYTPTGDDKNNNVNTIVISYIEQRIKEIDNLVKLYAN